MKNKKFGSLFALNIALFVIFIFGITELWYNPVLGVIQISVSILLAFFSYLSINKNYGKISEYIENVTFHVDNATKDSVINAPMPICILKQDGKILWNNPMFDVITNDEDLFDQHITTLIEDFDIDKLISEKSARYQVGIYGRHFTVFSSVVRMDKKDGAAVFAVLYWIDDTVLFEKAGRFDEEKPVIGIINIDNYDDVFQNTPDTNTSMLSVEIESKINDWFSFTNGVIRKYERDKFFILFEHKYLGAFIDNKFSVLDAVKEINQGNKIPVTLSIGIGNLGENFHTNDKYAQSAINLSLGRGGDQAVIKDNESVRYFGGKTREHEKTTKVKARVVSMALKELMQRADNVLIMGHKIPDIDSIGAAVGILIQARAVGKPTNIVLDSANASVSHIINRLKITGGYDETFINPERALEVSDENTLLVVVDTHRPSFTSCPELLKNKPNVVLIDHHRRGAEFIENANLIYHEPYASSTCEMVAELLQYAGDKLKMATVEAEAIYAGMVLDTKDFSVKTGVRTFEAAAFLKRRGVDTSAVKQIFKNDFESFVAKAKVVTGAEIISPNIAVSICPSELVEPNIISAQAADELLNIKGIEASFVMYYQKGMAVISGRSTGRINVQMIMEKMGGGGHQTVAGAQFKAKSMTDAKERLIRAINEYTCESC